AQYVHILTVALGRVAGLQLKVKYTLSFRFLLLLVKPFAADFAGQLLEGPKGGNFHQKRRKGLRVDLLVNGVGDTLNRNGYWLAGGQNVESVSNQGAELVSFAGGRVWFLAHVRSL